MMVLVNFAWLVNGLYRIRVASLVYVGLHASAVILYSSGSFWLIDMTLRLKFLGI